MSKILVAEDEWVVREAICTVLEAERHFVESVDNGTDALHYLLSGNFDAAVLDWHMPGMAGIDVCRDFRSSGGRTPILMLTAKATVHDKTVGLDTGADDYLTKPFDSRELVARVRALLRRPAVFSDNVLKYKDLEVDTVKHRVVRNGKLISLLPLEFAVLEFLMRHQNQVLSGEKLLDSVWKSQTDCSTQSVRNCIYNVRRKLDDSNDDPIIKTVYGVGYILGER